MPRFIVSLSAKCYVGRLLLLPPTLSVQIAVINRFGYMLRSYFFGIVHIGYRAGYFEDSVIRSG
jgi:hypothetical protein